MTTTVAKRVSAITFEVVSVVWEDSTYQFGDNHDPDGDSDGTTIVVSKP